MPDIVNRFAFDSEKQLQNILAKALILQGVEVQTEVTIIEGLRADIVTSSSIIEVKLRLKRESLFTAVGQVLTYKHHLEKSKAVIIGCQVDMSTIKYFRAIQPIVQIIHLQSGHLKNLRNFVDGIESGLDFKGKPLTDQEIANCTKNIKSLLKKLV